MPLFGLGTYLAKGEDVRNAVIWALEQGYRHIDTAAVYKNHKDVGKAIQESKVSRKELFITSKVAPIEHGYEKTIAACEKVLKELGIDYLDLYLIHWPAVKGLKRQSPKNAERRKETWTALEELYKQGKCKAIGVSNYTISHIEELLKHCKVVPAVNQVEYHPHLFQKDLLKFCESKGIQLEAYSSLGSEDGELMEDPKVKEVAKKYKKTVAQILLRWGIQQIIPIIPKSVHKDRIIENSQLFDFEINKKDMETLFSLDKGEHYCWDPTDVA